MELGVNCLLMIIIKVGLWLNWTVLRCIGVELKLIDNIRSEWGCGEWFMWDYDKIDHKE